MQTEHWPSSTQWRYWYTSDLCGRSGNVEYLGMFNGWKADVASSTTMADLETLLQAAGGNVYVYVGGTPPYNQEGTGAYNGNYNCENVLKPIAALFTKYNIPFSRLMVAGTHNEERKVYYGYMPSSIVSFNSVWQACQQQNAPGAAFLDNYKLSMAGFPSTTIDGLHAGPKMNMLKVQMLVQQLSASVP